MKNIIRYEIHYGGSLRSGMLNISKASMRQNKIGTEQLNTFNLHKNKFISNEQSIVLSLSKLLKNIMILNEALLSGKNNYLYQDSFKNRKIAQFDKDHFQNLDKLIKGEKFNLIKNTLIDQSQDINQINKNFSQEEISILQMSNCVGLKFIEVIYKCYSKLDEKTYIDEYVLEKIYNLCVPFKDELLLSENYNLYNPNNEMFDIAKLFFDSKEKIVYNETTNLSQDEFDLI